MKKTLSIVLSVLLAFCACQKAVTPPAEEGGKYALSQLRFDFTVESGSGTKGVRTGWQNGDKVFIFFEGISTAYVTVTHDGSGWSADPELPGGMSEPELGSDGFLTAVYLPYGNTLAPVWNGSAWTFPGTNDYYYLKAEKVMYYITDTENALPTLGAYLYMDTADDFVQFFLPDNSATNTIQLACNALIPAGIASVGLDGTIAETTSAQGGWVTARTDTIDGEKGYYASGKLSPKPGLQYYFAIDEGGSYKHFFKQRADALTGRGAYQLPAAGNWLDASSSSYVEIAGNSWCATNLGADTPWEAGTVKTPAQLAGVSVSNAKIPSDDEWNLLLDRTKAVWIQLSILGTDGFLVLNHADSRQYFFLPVANYWSSDKTESDQHYMKTDDTGTHEITISNPPANAYVRLLSTLQGGSFNPPDDGGDI